MGQEHSVFGLAVILPMAAKGTIAVFHKMWARHKNQLASFVLLIVSVGGWSPEIVLRADAEPFASQTTQLLTLTQGLPIEFRADIQLKWFEAQTVRDRAKVKGVVKSLFEGMDSAGIEYPIGYAAIVQSNTFEQEFASASAVVRLDSLSLRLRILRDMLPVERSWSINHLRDLRFQVSRIDCEDSLLPDVSDFYRAIGEMVFTAQDRDRSADVGWFAERVGGIDSPIELESAAALIANLKLPEQDHHLLIMQLGSVLAQSSATDRELDRLGGARVLASTVKKLISSQPKSSGDAAFLLASYRKFIISSSKQPACADRTTNWNVVVEDFNNLLREFSQSDSIAEVSVPERLFTGGKAIYRSLPDDSKSDEVLGKMHRLRTDKMTTLVPSGSTDSLWQSYSADLMAVVGQVDPGESPCSDCAYFYKTKILLAGFDLVPDGQLKGELLRSSVGSISNSGLQSSNPELWVFQIQLLLNMARKPTPAQEKRLKQLRDADVYLPFGPSTMADEIRRLLLEDTNPVLRAYAFSDVILGGRFSAPYLR